jgi:uncharacterized protein YegP (UPF0339 family)
MAHFEIYRDHAGEWRFRLRADNGEIVATSEGYTSIDSAFEGIDVVRRLAQTATVDDEVLG